MRKCTSHSYTHPGHMRMNNEDSYYSNDESSLWIVCDGMGGHQEGNFASHLVTDIFEYVDLRGTFENKIEHIQSQFYNIQKILEKKAHKLGNNAIIGTTLVLLLIDDNQAATIHSGDSRCYVHRHDKLSMVTQDHAKNIPGENGDRKALTRALSAPGTLSLEVQRFAIEKDDVYLLCSDGFYDNLSNADIKNGLALKDLKDCMNSMTSTVLSGKADDNLTAIIIRVG